MRYLLFILFISSSQLQASNCTTTSLLSNDWTVGTSVTAIVLGLTQVLGASASFIGDYIFYKKTPSQRILDLQQNIENERAQAAVLKTQEPRILKNLVQKIRIKLQENDEEFSDEEILQIISRVKKIIDKFVLVPESVVANEVFL